jgi:uncharacterized membrane protein
MGFVGTLCSAIPLIYFGRRSCYIFGLSTVVTILFIVAFMCLAKDYATNQNYAWAQATLLIALQFVWQMTLGPLTYGSSSQFLFSLSNNISGAGRIHLSPSHGSQYPNQLPTLLSHTI